VKEDIKMSEKRVLDVVKVGFHGNTGDNRSPESFAFPACMASLMQYLGENYPIMEIEAHNQKYKMRTANLHFMAASGMAFGLLWHREYCMSCMDLMQVNDHNATIKHAYDWAGYEFEVVEKSQEDNNREYIKEKIIESINKGVPVLAFGIIGPPECLIINGYDNNGDVFIGWSHFQEWEKCDKEPNGMFRKTDWYEGLWKIVITGKKIGRMVTIKNILSLGLSIMQKTESEGYFAGLAAYDEWVKYVLNPELENVNDETLKARHGLHHHLVGNLAEARCWGGEFLIHISQEIEDENIKGVVKCFKDIHDLCWKVWGVLGEYGQKEVWKGFRNNEKRKKIAAILADIKSLDEEAIGYLKLAVEEKEQ
jgi:hypothetical protein